MLAWSRSGSLRAATDRNVKQARETMKPLGIERYSNIVVLTGAGVSVASGLRPYRGTGGIWEEDGVAELATPTALRERPEKVWALFGALRRQVRTAAPNAAHLALARAEQNLAEGRQWTLITQNVDGLHQVAGGRNVVELHGSLFRTRCSSPSCDLPPFRDDEPHTDTVPECARCRAVLRPDIVLFDEAIPVDAERQAKRALRDCDLFVAVGTSGTVSPASNFVRSAEYAGARTVLVNLDPMKPRHPAYDEEVLGRAEEILPVLLGLAVGTHDDGRAPSSLR